MIKEEAYGLAETEAVSPTENPSQSSCVPYTREQCTILRPSRTSFAAAPLLHPSIDHTPGRSRPPRPAGSHFSRPRNASSSSNTSSSSHSYVYCDNKSSVRPRCVNPAPLQTGVAIHPATILVASRSGLSACVDGRISAAGPAGP